MTTDRQKSFIATLGTDNIPLHFLDLLHGEPAIASSVFASGGFFTGPPQRRDDSHRLGLHPEISADAIPGLLLYFRYTNYGYRLYIRTPGPYFGKCISVDTSGFVGAFPIAGSTTFNLINRHNRAMTLDDIKEDSLETYIQVSGSGLLHRQNIYGSKYTYIANKGQTPLLCRLKIHERNATYLSTPDEI
ncbi:hypothetical protein [Pseudomonas serbica]